MGKITGQLVPVERDEKKLRRTALILTAFAIMGGIGIISAYARFAKNANREDRPSYVGELRHNLPVVRQDGQRSGLDSLQGKVWIVNSVSVTQPESCTLSQSMVKAMEEKYRDNPDVAFVSMVIDPGAPETATKVLTEAAATQNASLPKWWLPQRNQSFYTNTSRINSSSALCLIRLRESGITIPAWCLSIVR